MQREAFKSIIEENRKILGYVIGDCTGTINGTSFMICECGGPERKYYAYCIDTDSSKDKYYGTFDEAINNFIVNGDTIVNQIDKLSDFGFIDYSD